MREVLSAKIKKAGYLHNMGVIQGINLTLGQGELVCLIGPNGAGKSTVIKAIIGVLPELVGEIRFAGEKKDYFYLPEQPILYDDLTLWEHLELAGSFREMERTVFLREAERLLELFDLQQVKGHLPPSFSKGMQQKVMITLGLLLRPALYLIDEPFVGLDPRAALLFMEALQEERKRGAAILLSTHQLDIAEKISDFFVLMVEGKIAGQGTLFALREQCGASGASLFDCFNLILEEENESSQNC